MFGLACLAAFILFPETYAADGFTDLELTLAMKLFLCDACDLQV